MKQQILDLIAEKELSLDDYSDHYDVIDALDYDGSLHDLIDANVEIYDYQLRQWAVDNWNWIEDAIAEGLVDTSEFDYHKAIQAGQYLQLRQEAHEAIEEIFNEYEETANV